MPPKTQPLREGTEGAPPLKRLRAWQAACALLAVAGLAAALYAASPLARPSDSDEGTLRGLQIRVLTISQAAAENRMDGALAALEALEKDLNDAASQGLISVSRYRGIEAALDSVRGEITGQIAAVSAAAAEAPTAGTASSSSAPEPVQQPAQVVPQPPLIVQAPAPEVVPVQEEPELPEPAKEAKGKGKGPGKP
ncbi:hypothetical protein M8J71_09675 [Pseudarthrobacter sp. R1]|uniref:hypothetical protein n=1 Tax=Pseudarthrobacter sp. R1 TaxID=2944934 RepID=UPI00210D6304|nr:hypothetical protein [Pseudarthrobacter sp. R1]MCQ6270748.1 hypothetical protein [Pseudarthrobacter sp. R1]